MISTSNQIPCSAKLNRLISALTIILHLKFMLKYLYRIVWWIFFVHLFVISDVILYKLILYTFIYIDKAHFNPIFSNSSPSHIVILSLKR